MILSTIILLTPVKIYVEGYSISGAGLPGTFNIDCFEVHWGADSTRGSEHTVDGRQYAGEVRHPSPGYKLRIEIFAFLNTGNTACHYLVFDVNVKGFKCNGYNLDVPTIIWNAFVVQLRVTGYLNPNHLNKYVRFH